MPPAVAGSGRRLPVDDDPPGNTEVPAAGGP